MWTILQLIFLGLGILFGLGANKLSMPILTYAGISCFGLGAMAIGWEAIIKRRFKLGRRRSGSQETYIGFPAVLQGIQFNMIGLFLLGAAMLAYRDIGQEFFLDMVRRPGIALVVIGLLLLLQSFISFLGYREIKKGPGWMVTMNLISSRLLPGVVLLVLGLGAAGLGMLEIVAPDVFDALGGGILESFYGLR